MLPLSTSDKWEPMGSGRAPRGSNLESAQLAPVGWVFEVALLGLAGLWEVALAGLDGKIAAALLRLAGGLDEALAGRPRVCARTTGALVGPM